MAAVLAIYNSSNYNSPQEASASGALYQQPSDWTYDNTCGLDDLLEIVSAINNCHNGQTEPENQDFVMVIWDNEQWLSLETWSYIKSEVENSPLTMNFITKNKATKIGEVDGVSFYEHPTEGDEHPLLMVFGSLVGSSTFLELPDKGDF